MAREKKWKRANESSFCVASKRENISTLFYEVSIGKSYARNANDEGLGNLLPYMLVTRCPVHSCPAILEFRYVWQTT